MSNNVGQFVWIVFYSYECMLYSYKGILRKSANSGEIFIVMFLTAGNKIVYIVMILLWKKFI